MDIKEIYENGSNVNQDWKLFFLEIEIEFHMFNIKSNDKYSLTSIEKSKNHIYKCLEKYYKIKKVSFQDKIKNKKYFENFIEEINKPIPKGEKVNMEFLNFLLSSEKTKITIKSQLYLKV